jgi:MFS transporter, MCT family, solute carrier family 16 (monocarboxylic acid transporters), member 14
MILKIIMGYVGDHPRVDTLIFCCVTTSIAGAATLFVPLLAIYPLLATYCGLYGFFISANYALTTIILVDLLGMKRLTNAFGFVSFSEGIANLIGPPVAGCRLNFVILL